MASSSLAISIANDFASSLAFEEQTSSSFSSELKNLCLFRFLCAAFESFVGVPLDLFSNRNPCFRFSFRLGPECSARSLFSLAWPVSIACVAYELVSKDFIVRFAINLSVSDAGFGITRKQRIARKK